MYRSTKQILSTIHKYFSCVWIFSQSLISTRLTTHYFQGLYFQLLQLILCSFLLDQIFLQMWIGLLDLECLQYKFLTLHCEIDTYFLGNKFFHQHSFPLFSSTYDLKKFLKVLDLSVAIFLTLSLLSNATFFQYRNSFTWVWLIKSIVSCGKLTLVLFTPRASSVF